MQTSQFKAIFHWAGFSTWSDIFFCLKTNWQRVGVKTKENIIPRKKLHLVENDPKAPAGTCCLTSLCLHVEHSGFEEKIHSVNDHVN